MKKISKLLLLISLIFLVGSVGTSIMIGSIKTGGFDGTLILIYLISWVLIGISVPVFIFSFIAASICIAGDNDFPMKGRGLLFAKIIQFIIFLILCLLVVGMQNSVNVNFYFKLELIIILYILFTIIGMFTSVPLILGMKKTEGIKVSDIIVLYSASAFPILDLILMVLVYTKTETEKTDAEKQ